MMPSHHLTKRTSYSILLISALMTATPTLAMDLGTPDPKTIGKALTITAKTSAED